MGACFECDPIYMVLGTRLAESANHFANSRPTLSPHSAVRGRDRLPLPVGAPAHGPKEAGVLR